jgi:hypothetical protein
MKRVCNDNRLKPEKVKNRHTETYQDRWVMSKNYGSCTKIAEFNTN